MKKNSRGFTIYTEFKDTYSNTVRLQKSSSAMLDRVWIFTEPGPHFQNSSTAPAPHLNKQQAKWLIKALTKFVEGK